ncbi:MAG TPA: DNA-3-methyladenine glycosylase I [Candidatus Saccharimonadia bacterium]|nr:DNA-3-methyladenine glycosylase I [Candidatus Saccharimonadia bacterium]
MTILRRRQGYRAVFANFDAMAVAQYGWEQVAALLAETAIIRNRLKVTAAINNAQKFLEVQRLGRS